jgi:hypothetical protein
MLTRPRDRRFEEAGDADPLGQSTVDGGLDEARCEDVKRGQHSSTHFHVKWILEFNASGPLWQIGWRGVVSDASVAAAVGAGLICEATRGTSVCM